MGRRGRRWAAERRSALAVSARALLVTMMLAACAPLHLAVATTVESMATSAQAVSADRIFVGTVTSVSSRPKASAPKYFETVVHFAVEETVAGSVPAEIEIVLSGGEVGGVRQRVDGMPEFTT